MSDASIRIEIDSRGATRGARTIRRDLDSIDRSADRTQLSIGRVGKALAALAAVEGLRRATLQYAQFADTVTNIENRLRAAGVATQELDRRFQQLRTVAIQTRSSFESTVEVFSRLAVSSSELGVTQSELIRFTQSLNQAVQLSGASATEANAALIQLSQGLASGALRGDELRSVLEQLPIVADVIAQELGVTRGALRELGADGAITAQVVVDAFRNAGNELNDRFGRQVGTVAQEFEVFNTVLLDFIRVVDDVTGASDRIAASIRGISSALTGATAVIQQFSDNADKSAEALALRYQVVNREIQELNRQLNLTDRQQARRGINPNAVSGQVALLESELLELERLFNDLQGANEVLNDTSSGIPKTTENLSELRETATDLVASLDPVTKAQMALADGSQLLNDAFDAELITQEQYGRALGELERRLNDARLALDTVGAANDNVLRVVGRTRDDVDRMAAAFDRANQPVEQLAQNFDNAAASASNFGNTVAFTVSRALSSLSAGNGVGDVSQVANDLAFGGQVNQGLQQAFDPSSPQTFGSLLRGGGGNLSSVGFAIDNFINPLPAGQFGPQAPGFFTQAGANFNFASSLAGLGAGFVSDLVFGSSTESQIGQAAGGILGTALAPTGLGPVGAILGTLGGGFIGSLFGGQKPPNLEGNTTFEVGSGVFSVGGQEGDKFSQENRDASLAIAQQIDAFAALLIRSTGASIEEDLRVIVGDRDGIGFERGQGGNNTEFGPANDTRRLFGSPEELVTAAFVDIQAEIASQIDGPIRQYVEALDVTQEIDVARVTSDLELLQSGGRLFEEFTDSAGPVEQQMQQINAVFDAASEQLDRIAQSGVDVSEAMAGLNANLEETRGILVRDFEAGLQDRLLGINSPTALQVVQLGREREFALAEAASIGASTDLVNQVFDALFDQLVRIDDVANDIGDTTTRIASLSGAFNSIGGAADRLLIDPNLSPLSPADRLAEAEAQFNALAQVAQFGEGDEQIRALEQLETLTQTYLQASQSYYANSEGFYEDFLNAEAVLRETESLTARMLRIEEAQLAELQRIAGNDNGAPGAANQNFGANVALNQQLAAITGFTGNFGGQAFTSFAQGLSPAVQQQVNDAIAGAGGTPVTFNTGGSFRVGGQPGVDSNLFSLALTRGEYVEISREDNMGAMAEALAELRGDMQALARTVSESAAQTTKAVQDGNDQRAEQVSAMNRAASRPAA